MSARAPSATTSTSARCSPRPSLRPADLSERVSALRAGRATGGARHVTAGVKIVVRWGLFHKLTNHSIWQQMSKSVRPLGQKHHYSPVFYLKRWAGPDDRLCEYSRPYDRAKPRMTHPEGTGYDFVPTESSQLLVEQRFMRIVDQKASETMEALLDGKDISALNLDQKSAWSRFVMSLVQRNPEKVAWITQVVDAHYDNRLARLEADYDSIRTPGYPLTFAEYRDRVAPKTREILKAELLTTIVDSQNVGATINRMLWGVATLTDLQPRLLTSDRPVVMTKGIAYPTSHMMLPINPRAIFIAANTSLHLAQLCTGIEEGTLLYHINHTVAAQAKKFVYFIDDSQLKFVEARLGKFTPQFIAPAQYPQSP